MTTAIPAPNTMPAPRPLWERHKLFQEPVYAEVLASLEDDSDEDDN